MNDQTLAREEMATDSPPTDVDRSRQQSCALDERVQAESHAIAIAATFTAELLQQPLKFWMRTLEIDADITLAPYAQVMQELLNPHSLLSENTRGFNVLLIRLEDWIRDRLEEGVEANIEHSRRAALEFANGVRALRVRTSTSILIYFCPCSSTLPDVYRQLLNELQLGLVRNLGELAHTHCWTHADLVQLYSVADHEDARADRVGHIPYTQEYFAAIATLFARRIGVLLKPQRKVIAVDCDNTLWKGVCGEDGPMGVDITPAHLDFQRLLVRQHDAGILLCLCSKNNPVDVEEVFQAHPEMPLRQEHLICSRVNWKSKSSNLQSLAQELDLALESFIFIDDSPLECAEVKANCPNVLALHLPCTQEEISHFLRHQWSFDRVGVTEEAKQRTEQYRRNRARNKALEDAEGLQQFLESLELKVDIGPMQPGQLTRVAELVQRTNQFNLTGRRRRAGEIEALWRSGDMHIWVVQVRDRFGDYGLVGAVFFKSEASGIDIDMFVLSCRALGRGVEYRIVNELGRVAREQQLSQIVLRFRATSRNTPARIFLERSFLQFGKLAPDNDASAAESTFEIPVEYALALAGELTSKKVSEQTKASSTEVAQPRFSTKWHEAAYRFSRVGDVIAEIGCTMPTSRARLGTYVAPRTAVEKEIAAIWGDILGCDEVSVDADFFELGGNSLLAVQVIASIGTALGLELSIYDFFEEPSVEGVARRLAGAELSGSAIERVDPAGPVAMSSAQKRLWFIDRLVSGSPAYHIPFAVRLHGALDRNALQEALDALVRRHEVLRTTFSEVEGKLVQKIAPHSQFALEPIDLSDVPEAADRDAAVRGQSNDEIAAPFDLTAGPLIRGRLFRLAEKEHVLLITMHHIVSDGWSMGVLVRELGTLYDSFREGRPDPLPALPIRYADYAHWQQLWLSSAELQNQLAYWRDHLRGAPELLNLPTDRPRPAVQTNGGANVPISFGRELTQLLKGLSRRFNLTLAMILFACWSIVLSRLSGQGDVVIGMPVANRRRSELGGMIGLFVNTLALRVRLQDDPIGIDLLEHVKNVMLGGQANQDVPFEQVVDAIQPARSLSHSPVFQVMFVFQNVPRSALRLSGLRVEEQPVHERWAMFDMTLELQESADDVVGVLNYATDLFNSATVERWAEYLRSVMRGLAHEPRLRVSRLPLMGEIELRRVISLSNLTGIIHSHEKTIHQLFEEQVDRAPRAVAVAYEHQSLTYEDLNAKANQLAWYLRSLGVGGDGAVAICVERSLDLVVGLLGILKAGGAYVPLDPYYPPDRLNYMLNDAAPRVLLTQHRLRDMLSSTTAKVVELDSGWEAIDNQPSENLTPYTRDVGSCNLAYVIYTSGSTGYPKGVMVEHRNVVSLWQDLEGIYQSTDCRYIAVNASFNFDASVKQLVQLLSGRTIVLIPDEVRLDPTTMIQFVREARIDGIDCTPSQLKSWISAGLLHGSYSHPRLVLVGGEPIDTELWRTLAECAEIDFYNVYGPTESTVDATFTKVNGDRAAPHIGHPLASRQVYVLDDHGQIVPIGVVGEIYLGGSGVARGYLNRPGHTAERFVPDSFSGDSTSRLYKTGDLGRWRADGAVESLGRNDYQIKVRGIRIELAEIETQLARHEHVLEVAVVPREDSFGEKRLIAYLTVSDPVGAAGIEFTEMLRAHLRSTLPEYMMPSAFVVMESLPITANGKLDLRALPTPKLGAYVSSRHEAPQGAMEQALAKIWQNSLEVDSVSRHDNFFDLGGHSLLVLTTLFRINEHFASDLKVTDFYRSPTLRELAARIGGDSSEDAIIDLSKEAILDETLVASAGVLRVPAEAILLTGATGFVGRFLLVQLLRHTEAKIYCLVRGKSAHLASARLRAILSKWDLWHEEFERRIIVVPGDLRLGRFGLDAMTYAMLSRSIDSIYHCATSMNHLETYVLAKKANVDALRDLLRFATDNRPKIVNYISTLSIFTASSTPTARIVVEDTPIEHELHRSSAGYAASKWVAEKIFMLAGERGIPCNIFRLGLIWADTEKGRYDELQRVYRTFKSCLISGFGIQNYRFDIAPTPVDYAARAIVHLAERHSRGGAIFHISSSDQKVNGLFERCNEIGQTSLQLLPYYDWIQEMKRLHRHGYSLPAVPLIEFAFSMEEASFYEWQGASRYAGIHFDLSRTHRELEQEGITAPALDDEMLKACIQSMISRDVELREIVGGQNNVLPVKKDWNLRLGDWHR